MKKFFLFIAFFTALIFVVSCGGSSKNNNNENPDTGENVTDEDTADTGSPDTDKSDNDTGSTDADSGDKTDSEDDADTAHDDADTTPVSDDDADSGNTEIENKDIYLGIIGFDKELFVKEIGLLDSSTADSYTSFPEALTYNSYDSHILYYADYTALEMMRDSLMSSEPERVFLITMIPSFPDQLPLDDNNYNPAHYGSNDEYLNALHDRIINEKIHGKKVEAYTIGWNSSDSEVIENMKKLSSCDSDSENCDDYVFTASNYDEMSNNLETISTKIYSSYKLVNLDVKLPGYKNGQRLRFAFDTYSDSHLYIEATYHSADGKTLENITYHGLTGNTSIATGSPDGDSHRFLFEDLKYEGGKKPLSDIDSSRVTLWKETSSGRWEKEPAFDHSYLGGNKQNTLIMLLLDTSSGNSYLVATTKGRKFVDTLISGNTDTAAEECRTVNGNWNNEQTMCWRNMDCSEIPATTSWNETSRIKQTWTGTSWQPEAISVYDDTPDSNSCRYTCKFGTAWDGSVCVTPTMCYPKNPCDSIDNSTGNCTEQEISDEYGELIETTYICGCQQGSLWNGNDFLCKQIPATFSECNTTSTTSLSFPCKETNYIWSELYGKMTWQQAKNHCDSLNSLNYAGFSSGWHLPTIDELRTLIKNCDKTITGGTCKITDNCSSPSCGTWDDCSCQQSASPKYSKFKDKDILWSSTAVSNYSATDLAWFVDFSQGQVSNMGKAGYTQFRCVRK